MAPPVRDLAELARAPRPAAEVGGKAVNLARLIAAGLPVPDGFVIAAPAAASREAAGRAAALGERLAVRSSAVIEDGAERAAPGLFDSRLGVDPGALDRAIEEVVASAATAAARAYAGGGVPAAMAVIVQRQVDGAAGVLYTRPPVGDEPDAMWIESGASRAVVGRDGRPRAVDGGFPLAPARIAELVRLALAAERAIGAAAGADLEWVAAPDRLWLVQARPRTGAAGRPLDPAVDEAIRFSRGDPRTWRWDASHNPDPLSPAQAGLVELVADLGGEEMRVVGGYLYTAPRAEEAAPVASAPPPDLPALFAARWAPAMERALAPVEASEPPALEEALAAYRQVYAIYAGELAPALRRARAALAGAAPTGASAVARALARDELLPLAPAWDVAAPGFDEDAALVARARARRPARAAAAEDTGDPVARAVAAIGEADDIYFFRAQRAVRRALLALAAGWGMAAGDIFFLPLAEVRRAAGAGRPPDGAAGIARAARAEREVLRARAMPLAFAGGRRVDPIAPARAPDLWRGRPAGPGSARGPVVLIGDLGHLDGDPRGRVVAAPSVTPATLVQLAGAVALVCEQGGALGHAAALARELAMPCVVGCAGITRELRRGDQLLVDGDAGLVVRVGGGEGDG